jgi:hypothetical protein
VPGSRLKPFSRTLANDRWVGLTNLRSRWMIALLRMCEHRFLPVWRPIGAAEQVWGGRTFLESMGPFASCAEGGQSAISPSYARVVASFPSSPPPSNC